MAIPTDAQLKAGAANQAAQKRITQIEHERDYWYARYQEMISQNYAITTGRPMSRPDVSPPASSWVDRSQQTMEQRLTVLIEHIRTVLINERLQNFTTQEALEKITDLINGRGNHLATKP